MISVLVYGRNDSHGYNLHKRCALSLNCLAHVLEDDDEIIFVDYNTPAGIPTFIEGIQDTLTDAAIDRLRVIRVPWSVHRDRFAARTHLPIPEPVARNAGLRRMNPDNKWVLSTNTDMIFVPRRGSRLRDIIEPLRAGYYALPRFDLPEGLWELLDRRDPERALGYIGEWGRGLHLDEVISSYEWMGFDAPGDFQLVPREQLFRMRGFDERMLLGWHVDSNLSRRLSFVYDAPGDLSRDISGYHCDHTRIPGAYHQSERIQNDVHRFAFDVDRSDLPTQAESWGLADLELEEIDLAAQRAMVLPSAIAAVLPGPAREQQPIDARQASTSMVFHYRAPHVLPYVASALAVLRRDATIAYVGSNPELVELLAPLVKQMGFVEPLHVVDPASATLASLGTATTWDDASSAADAIVFDFGLPLEAASRAEPSMIADWPFGTRGMLGHTLAKLDELARLDTSASPAARPDRSYVVVNAVYNLLEPMVSTRVAGARFQFNQRTRHGLAIDPAAALPLSDLERSKLRWAVGFGLDEHPEPRYELGTTLKFTQPGAERFFDGGWSWVESVGTWTESEHAGVVLPVQSEELGDCAEFVLLTDVLDAYVPTGRAGLDVEIAVNGERVDQWHFPAGVSAISTKRTVLDPRIVESRQPIRVDLHVSSPVSPVDDGTGGDWRTLGVCIAGMTLKGVASLHLGDVIPTASPAPACPLLIHGWSWSEYAGTWTDGTEATIRLPVVNTAEPEFDLVFDIGFVFVRPHRTTFPVEVVVDGVPMLCWWFSVEDGCERRLTLPTRRSPREIRLRIPNATSPHALGETSDRRKAGLLLKALRIETTSLPEPGPVPTPDASPERRSRRLRR